VFACCLCVRSGGGGCSSLLVASLVYGRSVYKAKNLCYCQERPYHDDSTASRLLSEVKHRRAQLVLRWGTTLESWVLFFLFFLFFLPCVVGGHFATSTSGRGFLSFQVAGTSLLAFCHFDIILADY
jgi:hypothetical protein